jgi:hypothetical protein
MSDTARRALGPPGAGPDVGDDAAVIAQSLHAPECFGVLFDRHAPTHCRQEPVAARLRRSVR